MVDVLPGDWPPYAYPAHTNLGCSQHTTLAHSLYNKVTRLDIYVQLFNLFFVLWEGEPLISVLMCPTSEVTVSTEIKTSREPTTAQ